MTGTASNVFYEDNKKFQTTRDCVLKTEVKGYIVSTSKYVLDQTGKMLVYSGYAWDGASGGIDTKRTIRASLAHDVLYEMMRKRLIPRSEQFAADHTLLNIMRSDKAYAARAWAWFNMVSWFGRRSTDPKNRVKELVAP